MADDDTQQIDMRQFLADDAAPSTTQQEGTAVSFDWSWPKSTGLDMAQHAANTFLAVGGGDALNLWHLDYKTLLGLVGGAALVSLARAVVAYKLPVKAAKAVSATASST